VGRKTSTCGSFGKSFGERLGSAELIILKVDMPRKQQLIINAGNWVLTIKKCKENK
jgi:hypothetical protein